MNPDAPAGGFWQSPLVLHVMRWQIVGLRAELVSYGIVLAALAVLVVRRRRGRPATWWRDVLLAASAGALTGAAILLIVDDWWHEIPGGVPRGGRTWVLLATTVLGLVALNLFRTRPRRKVLAVAVVPPVVAVAVVGVNASYGIMHSLGELLDKPVAQVIDVADLPPVGDPGAPDRLGDSWLADSWTAPAGLPGEGRRVSLHIPGTVSGFAARAANIYLPPAALVDDAPVLPVVVLMMGQPGTPDATYVADALDAKAAGHGGLAPIVVVADQTGSPWTDTLCMDTPQRGNVETYINTDVVAWIKRHLRVTADRTGWTVAGYSNGGLCAARFAARHPQVWGNALDISGEEFPGSDHPEQHLAEIFGGDQAAYDRERLPRQLAAARLTDTWIVTTVSADDPLHVPGERRVAAAARAGGARSYYLEFPGGGHGVDTVRQALDQGFDILYPRLGLDAEVSPQQAAARPTPPIPAAD